MIGAVRQLYHATDTHPYFRAGFSANMYLKLTPEFNPDKKGNTYDGIALIRDDSIPDDEIHYISDDTRILKITNMRKMKDNESIMLTEEDGMDTENVEIDITDSDFIILARLAHEQNMTFNELVNNILRRKMEEEENSSMYAYTKNLHDKYTEEVDLQSGFTYVNWLEQKLYEGKQK